MMQVDMFWGPKPSLHCFFKPPHPFTPLDLTPVYLPLSNSQSYYFDSVVYFQQIYANGGATRHSSATNPFSKMGTQQLSSAVEVQ